MLQDTFKKEETYIFTPRFQGLNEHIIAGITHNECKTQNYAFQVTDSKDEVYDARHTLEKALKIPTEKWILMEQQHTLNFQKVTHADAPKGIHSFEEGISQTDALYTFDSDILLGGFFADCTPIYIYHPKTDCIGIIHAGYEGSMNGITRNFIYHLAVEESIDPSEIIAVIGPGISKFPNIITNDEMLEIQEKTPFALEESYVFTRIDDNYIKFDQSYLNYLSLIHEGLLPENISVTSLCSFSDQNLFHSVRRDKSCGRMLGFITRTS